MKKIILIISLAFITISLFGNFSFFPDNPADIAQRNYSHITLPLMTYELSLNNTFLRFDDLRLFQKGRRLSESEKGLLTNEDISVFGNVKSTLIDFGHKNWNFSLRTIAAFDVEVFEKMYTNFVFNGNESNVEYTSHNSEGSDAFVFWKASFEYAHPNPLSLGQIPGLFPVETDNIYLSGLRDLPIYVAANFDLNYSLLYAGIVESSQRFGTTPSNNYYDIYTRFMNTDKESSGQFNPSFGFGLKIPVYSGFFHFSMDDIFLQLNFKNLEGWIYAKEVTDNNALLQPYHEAIELENVEIDTIRTKSKTVKMNPSYCFGGEYPVFSKLNLMMRYSNDQFAYTDGFYTAGEFKLGAFPFQMGLGYHENIYYQIKTGLNFGKFEWMLGLTSYYGFFRYARGIGLHSAVIVKY